MKMDDLISRSDVLDKAIFIPIAKIMTKDKVIYRKAVFVDDIEKIPSAQQWIPCSERPPEEEGEYLCCDEEGSRWVDSFQDGEWFMEMFSGVEWLAWMPLPEPWKGGEDKSARI